MLADISSVDAIYIVCGRTDMRKSIDGLCAVIQEQFSMEIDHTLFLFCGRRCDRIKAILKEPLSAVFCYPHIFCPGWPPVLGPGCFEQKNVRIKILGVIIIL